MNLFWDVKLGVGDPPAWCLMFPFSFSWCLYFPKFGFITAIFTSLAVYGLRDEATMLLKGIIIW